jgi:hypothetical protein
VPLSNCRISQRTRSKPLRTIFAHKILPGRVKSVEGLYKEVQSVVPNSFESRIVRVTLQLIQAVLILLERTLHLRI